MEISDKITRFSFIKVTTPGCEGTINLMWDEYPIAWINNIQIAREIMQEIPEMKKDTEI